jgi:hypothetical protein
VIKRLSTVLLLTFSLLFVQQGMLFHNIHLHSTQTQSAAGDSSSIAKTAASEQSADGFCDLCVAFAGLASALPSQPFFSFKQALSSLFFPHCVLLWVRLLANTPHNRGPPNF